MPHRVGSCNGGVPGQPWSMPDCLFARGIHSGIARILNLLLDEPHCAIEAHAKANWIVESKGAFADCVYKYLAIKVQHTIDGVEWWYPPTFTPVYPSLWWRATNWAWAREPHTRAEPTQANNLEPFCFYTIITTSREIWEGSSRLLDTLLGAKGSCDLRNLKELCETCSMVK